jgi:hypothetical protein
VGLGIPLLKLAAEMAEGDLKLTSEQGAGTRLEVSFRHSHLDRMPLGDLAATFLTVLVSYPQIHWVFEYAITLADGRTDQFLLDDSEIKAELGDLSLTEPEVLSFLRRLLEEGIQALMLQIVQ